MIQSLSSRIFLQYRFNCESSFLDTGVSGFSTHSASWPTAPCARPVRLLGSQLGGVASIVFWDMPHAPAFRWLRSYRAKCNAEIQINFKKIQRRYSSSCSTSHCSHSESRGQHSRHCSNCPAQATEETARLALQVRYLFIRGKPLCQAVACHSPLVPFGETPETIAQYVFDQPLTASRIQRPADAPTYK